MTRIAILGAGAWGCALGCAMVRAGHEVHIWGRDKVLVDQINNTGTNAKYLGDIKLPDLLVATTGLDEAIKDAVAILVVVPAQTIAHLCKTLDGKITPEQVFITCAKGIDRQSGRTPAEMIGDIADMQNIGALSGPSFAADVANGLPTAVTIAFHDMDISRHFAQMFSSENFRIYTSDDLAGVEMGGALKNVLALAVGAARGMGLGASAEAALIARGFGELKRLAGAMGGRQETLSGLSGLGDLVLTASSTQSRNFSYGMALGRGDRLDGLPLAEGAFSAQIAARLAREKGIEVPVIEAIGEVVGGSLTAQQAVRQLLSRPLKAEHE